MAFEVDKSDAMKLLNESYIKCQAKPVENCLIKPVIDFVLDGENCLTYRYIMLTNILAKAVEPRVDILSLQAGDSSTGAFDARSLASKVVYLFQKTMLGNVLDGANSDPLVNKPGRYLRLDKSNAAAKGNPTTALHMLCDNLPKIKTKIDATKCIDYIVSLLIEKKTICDAQRVILEQASRKLSVFQVREFMSALLDKCFGGTALVLVATALCQLQYKEDDFQIIAHPVNQSGSSKRQFSDLDVLRNNTPFMGIELKDKPFSALDVERAANTAHKAGVASLMFVAGRQSAFASQPPTYFNNTREDYAKKGLYIGVISVDSLMDVILSKNIGLNAEHIISNIRETAEKIGALEAQIWVYQYMAKYINEII